MTALGLVLSLLFVPNIQKKQQSLPLREPVNLSLVLRMFNPLRIFRPFIYPNVFLCVSEYEQLWASPTIRLNPTAFYLRFTGDFPICYPHIRTLNLQSSFPPDDAACQRPFLPFSRNWIPHRQCYGWQAVRSCGEEVD